jgi:plasmid stabilization system protein ParE
MAYKLIWSPSAHPDLKDIASYIAETSFRCLVYVWLYSTDKQVAYPAKLQVCF